MNRNMLMALLALNGKNVSALAKLLNVSKGAIYNKLSGKSQFLAGEILVIKNEYQLTAQEVDDIFFRN